jgi:RNA polymerase sigma factor (sigma-70 family)
MRNTILLDDFELDSIMVKSGKEECDREYRRMLKALTKAVDGELTKRQRECVRLYYYEGKNLVQIAQELQIGAPTVSKHLKKARMRLSAVLRYSFGKLE